MVAASLGDTSYPRPNDIAVCLPKDNACTEDADCAGDSATACVGGVCVTPSLNECALLGKAQGAACDADGLGEDNGTCQDPSGAGATTCWKSCVPSTPWFCADPATGAPTATQCTVGDPNACGGGAAAALCAIPTAGTCTTGGAECVTQDGGATFFCVDAI